MRYLWSSKHQYARFIGWVSLLGITLGVAVLILVLSVMNGFDRELSSRILGTVPHVVIESVVANGSGANGRDRQDSELPDLSQVVGLRGSFGFYESQGMITRNRSVSPIAIYGVDPRAADILPTLRAGIAGDLTRLLSEPRSMVLGASLARQLGLLLGDSVLVMMTRVEAGRVRPRLERFRVTGTFEIGAELDSALALIALSDARGPRFVGTGRYGTRLVLEDAFAAPEVTQQLRRQLGADWRVRDWSASYGELFRAVRFEKGMMFLLLVLIVFIASFNIVAGQTMLVNDKRGDIAILRTMGANDSAVLRVFLVQGMVTAVVGVTLGVVLGVLLALNITDLVTSVEHFFGTRGVLEGTYFNQVPSHLLASDILLICALTLSISALAAYMPASKALAVNPVVALHDS